MKRFFRYILTQYQKLNFLILKIYCPPYTHISCSGYLVHLKILNFFVLNTQYIFTQYQMLTFCILLLHIDTFHQPFFSAVCHFLKIIWPKITAVFRPISNANILWFSKYMLLHIDTFRVPYIRYILKLAKILCRIYGTF